MSFENVPNRMSHEQIEHWVLTKKQEDSVRFSNELSIFMQALTGMVQEEIACDAAAAKDFILQAPESRLLFSSELFEAAQPPLTDGERQGVVNISQMIRDFITSYDERYRTV